MGSASHRGTATDRLLAFHPMAMPRVSRDDCYRAQERRVDGGWEGYRGGDARRFVTGAPGSGGVASKGDGAVFRLFRKGGMVGWTRVLPCRRGERSADSGACPARFCRADSYLARSVTAHSFLQVGDLRAFGVGLGTNKCARASLRVNRVT